MKSQSFIIKGLVITISLFMIGCNTPPTLEESSEITPMPVDLERIEIQQLDSIGFAMENAAEAIEKTGEMLDKMLEEL